MAKTASRLTAVAVFAVLGGCIMFPFGSNQSPGLAPHLPATSGSDTGVLVLQFIKASRPPTMGPLQHAEQPLIVPERELHSLDTTRVRWALCIAGGMRGDCGIVISNQLTEVCMLWPDGRVLSLGSPDKMGWGRESRGQLPEAWRTQWLLDLPQSPVLHGYDGICPEQYSGLEWPESERRMVMDFLERMTVRPGLKGGFTTRTPETPVSSKP